MSVTIISKDVGDVKDRRCCGEVVWGLEDGIADYIKKEMRI